MKRILLIALAAITLQSASAADTLTVRIADMHCQKCYNRISERLGKLEGIDSLAPHLDKSYIFIRYDAKLPKPHECSEEKK